MEALARLHGVHTSYVDAYARPQRADLDVLVALLGALGVPLDTATEAPALLEEHRRGRARRHLEPVLVHRTGRPDTASVTISPSAEPSELWLTLELEDGTARRARLSEALGGRASEGPPAPGPPAQGPPAQGAHAAGGDIAVVPIDLAQLAGGTVPPGRHRLTLEGLGPPSEALLISAPRCPTTSHRLAAAFMPLHALRTDEDRGVGTYTDLARLGSWLSQCDIDLVATLPLYPAFLDPPADPSPYMPVSRLAYNELFVDPAALPEFGSCAQARELWSRSPAAKADALRAARPVQYEDMALLLRQVLEPMSQCLRDGRLPPRREAFTHFARRHPELEAYATFRARREDPAAEPGDARSTFHLYCQWAAHQQLVATAQRVSLFGDFPVGSHPEGFDPEWSPTSFVPRVHGGAPPDSFFPDGQDWGFRPLHPERMREDGYAFFTAALRRAFRHVAGIRIDHVMGLQRLYMIPEDAGGGGAYVDYHVDELHALVALEAHRRACVVAGEDLGTVPPEVRPRLARDRILRTWVFQFESGESDPLPAPPDDCLAALGTHDLPRFAAYLWGDDITEREHDGLVTAAEAGAERASRTRWRRRLLDQLGLAPDQEMSDLTPIVLEGCLRHLARSEAPIALVDLEDLWGERAQQNHPGTGAEAQNWRRRSARTLEQLEADTSLATLLESLAAERGA